MKHFITLAILTTLPGIALAHGNADDGIMMNIQHLVSSPQHLWPLLVFAGLAITFKRLPKRFMRRIKIKTRS